MNQFKYDEDNDKQLMRSNTLFGVQGDSFSLEKLIDFAMNTGKTRSNGQVGHG